MAKYLVKLTKFQRRYSIALPIKLVESRRLGKYRYIMLEETKGKPITIKGTEYEKDFE